MGESLPGQNSFSVARISKGYCTSFLLLAILLLVYVFIRTLFILCMVVYRIITYNLREDIVCEDGIAEGVLMDE